MSLSFMPMASLAAARFEPPNGQDYLGVSVPAGSLAAFYNAAGVKSHVAITNQYTTDQSKFAALFSRMSGYPNTTAMISWGIPMKNNAVTNGSEDALIDAQVAAVKAYGKPVFIRPDWEMQGNWYPDWDADSVSSAQYIASWRYIYTRFKSATNAAFVWCPNVGVLGGGKHAPFDWYPGDAYVDWVGVDAYPQYSSPITIDFTQKQGLNDFATFAASHQKPLMLAEWARGNSSSPPDTADVFNLIFDWAEKFPNTVKALIYFDFSGSTHHQLELYPVGAAAFRARTANTNKYILSLVNGTAPPTPVPTPVSKPVKGDLNSDGKVNVTDLSQLLTKWNTSGGTADLNGDGKVNVIDLSILLGNWT